MSGVWVEAQSWMFVLIYGCTSTTTKKKKKTSLNLQLHSGSEFSWVAYLTQPPFYKWTSVVQSVLQELICQEDTPHCKVCFSVVLLVLESCIQYSDITLSGNRHGPRHNARNKLPVKTQFRSEAPIIVSLLLLV
eukprot:2337997-Rhodomonas_salina.2